MRILGYLDHPRFKITVFKTDTRLSVKFEVDHLEQTYKFPDSRHLQRLQDVHQLVDPDFLAAVEATFEQMKSQRHQAMTRLLPPPTEEEFEEIL